MKCIQNYPALFALYFSRLHASNQAFRQSGTDCPLFKKKLPSLNVSVKNQFLANPSHINIFCFQAVKQQNIIYAPLPTLRHFKCLTFLVKKLTKAKGRIAISYCVTLEKKSKELGSGLKNQNLFSLLIRV